MKKYALYFEYDNRGRGKLELVDEDDAVVLEKLCRTGSIATNGQLVHACPPGLYTLVDRDGPSYTDHPAMHVPFRQGRGWWVPFYRSGDKTHLGIHPDGGAGGTEGCIGVLEENANDLMDRLQQILKAQFEVQIFVTSQQRGLR